MVAFSAFIIIYTLVTFAKKPYLTAMEVIMDVVALSFALDECLELRDSGFSFYFESVWNLFDVPIYIIFLGFIGLRISALFSGSTDLSDFAYDFLACNSVLLWPRLFAALGKLSKTQAFYTLHDNTKSYREIAWLLLQVFLGSAFLGFEQSADISEQFGTPLMVLFVAISVSANAKEEFMFLFSVKVMEEVKSDALYEFQPPFNLLAGIVVWPCSLIYSAETVGKLNRILLRVFYFPELVCIYLYEILVVKKEPQQIPVRPGLINHQQSYEAVPYSSSTSGIPTLGGIANGHHVEILNDGTGDHVKASDMQSIAEEGTASLTYSPSASESNGAGTESSYGFPPGPIPSSSRQRLHRLNTSDLTPTQGPEIVSPYFESICRFRDANKTGPSGPRRPSIKGDFHESGHGRTSCTCQAPTAAAIPRSASRRLSSVSSYYDRSRQGTDATLSNTFQWMNPLESDCRTESGGTDNGGVSVPFGDNATNDQPFYRQQQYRYQPRQQSDEETQKLARLMEIRYEEMRTRMEQIESKLDQLMDLIATTATANHPNH
ncbi:hypothetical protein BGX34_010207 [Mortierella sp. NVP85]|nr:hypothetical protein BGX34_010207 [Mortierella sp. NVP85]